MVHERRPYSALVGLMFEPFEICDDGDSGRMGDTAKPSFAHLVASSTYYQTIEQGRFNLTLQTMLKNRLRPQQQRRRAMHRSEDLNDSEVPASNPKCEDRT